MKKLVYLFGLFLVLAVVACNTDTKKDDTDKEADAAELIEVQSNALVDLNFDLEDIVYDYYYSYYAEDADVIDALYIDLMIDLDDLLAELKAVEVGEELVDAKALLEEDINEVIDYFNNNGSRMLELQKLYVVGCTAEDSIELDNIDYDISDFSSSANYNFQENLNDVLKEYDLDEDIDVYYQD